MTDTPERKKLIKKYWEDPDTVSMMDKNLHELETESIARHLKASDIVLNIGCGDGTAMKRFAERAHHVIGVDYSSHLCEKAKENLKGVNNTSILCFDFTEEDFSIIRYERPTVVVSQRFLINLESPFIQQEAIRKIFNNLSSDGLFIMAENFSGSFDRLNKLRVLMGLPVIKRHWHNLYLDEVGTKKLLEKYGNVESIESFDVYMLLTRVYGPMIFPVFAKNKKHDLMDESARKLSEQIDRLISWSPVFNMELPHGQNQTWVVRKK